MKKYFVQKYRLLNSSWVLFLPITRRARAASLNFNSLSSSLPKNVSITNGKSYIRLRRVSILSQAVSFVCWLLLTGVIAGEDRQFETGAEGIKLFALLLLILIQSLIVLPYLSLKIAIKNGSIHISGDTDKALKLFRK